MSNRSPVHDHEEPGTPRRRPIMRAAALVAAGLLCVVFVGLGIWQVQRLQWKLDLIERVETRLAAPFVPAPGPHEWAALTEDNAEYRRISVSGTFEQGHDTLVKAVTELGSGFWVMTPFADEIGFRLLVNRGFIGDEAASSGPQPPPEGIQEVRGLLRLSQPGGAFLRDNDPEGDRWFSRDTQAIAAAEGIGPVAPYFLDAEAMPNAGLTEPVGGLTVVTFRNTHLVYALTWFALAILLAGAVGAIAWRRARMPRH